MFPKTRSVCKNRFPSEFILTPDYWTSLFDSSILNNMLSVITIICMLLEVGFPAFMLMISYPFSHRLALFWSNYITRHCARVVFAILRYYRGFKFMGDRESKAQLPGQFLVISNHQSLMDIVVYFLFFMDHEVRFVAKDALNSVPMVGKMLRTQGHCMIPRKGSTSVAMKCLEQFGGRVMEQGQIPVIFPEGTRSRTGNLGKFYSAGFRRLLQTANLPVAVCALDGGWKLSKIGDLMRNLKRGEYRVKVLKVFPAPQSKEDQKLVLEEGAALIQAQLDEWRST